MTLSSLIFSGTGCSALWISSELFFTFHFNCWSRSAQRTSRGRDSKCRALGNDCIMRISCIFSGSICHSRRECDLGLQTTSQPAKNSTAAHCLHPTVWEKSPVVYQKSPIFCHKSPIDYQNKKLHVISEGCYNCPNGLLWGWVDWII